MPPIETETIRVRIPRSQLVGRLRSLPAILSGKSTDPSGNEIRDVFFSRFVHHLFGMIHEAFEEKSRGRADSTGEKWKPLSRKTIAQRPPQPPKSPDRKGILTKEQTRLWRGIFASTFARLAPRIGEGEAKARAAKIAWGVVKARGGKTKLEVLGSRKVKLLHVSGRLEDSLKPGRLTTTGYTPPHEQIFRQDSSSITIGSEVPYASRQHRHRRLWPSQRKMRPWFRKSAEKAIEALTTWMKRNIK